MQVALVPLYCSLRQVPCWGRGLPGRHRTVPEACSTKFCLRSLFSLTFLLLFLTLHDPEGSPRKQKLKLLPPDFLLPVSVVSKICVYFTVQVVSCASPTFVQAQVSHR